MYLYVLKLCAWKYKQRDDDDDDDEIKNEKKQQHFCTINNTYKLKRFASYWERERVIGKNSNILLAYHTYI